MGPTGEYSFYEPLVRVAKQAVMNKLIKKC